VSDDRAPLLAVLQANKEVTAMQKVIKQAVAFCFIILNFKD
jgi:hypothetical protein